MEESRKKDDSKLFFVAATVLDKRNRPVSIAENSYCQTHPAQLRFALRAKLSVKQYLHAEIAALIRAKGKGCSIIVTRLMKNGTAGNARPCPICFEAIRTSGIKNIYFTNEKSEIVLLEMD